MNKNITKLSDTRWHLMLGRESIYVKCTSFPIEEDVLMQIKYRSGEYIFDNGDKTKTVRGDSLEDAISAYLNCDQVLAKNQTIIGWGANTASISNKSSYPTYAPGTSLNPTP